MAAVKKVVCLANSRKLSGRCIAGREWSGESAGPWIRPVSDRENQEVSEYERQYPDGADPKVLDIMEIKLLRPCPAGWQTENWLLDPRGQWLHTGRCGLDDLAELADPISPLWIDGKSTQLGQNDCVPVAPTAAGSSLRLVGVPDLMIAVFASGAAYGNPKRRVQARFRHAERDYRLWITDPVYERKYLALPDGEYPLGASYLTVSISEPWQGKCYKLVAAIIETEPFST